MSIPVQVVVSHASLLPAVEEIQGRLGTIGGAQALWVLVGADDPQLPAKAVGQLRAMLATRGHEGGFAQVLLAQDAAALTQLVGQLRQVDVGRAPWGVVGIVLAEEREAAGLAALQLPSLHLVPAALAYRELAWRDRERSAVNLLGLLVDLARLPLAREAFGEWVSTYSGVRVTLAQAARFQAPMVQRVLARRLASRVADRMVESLQQGRERLSWLCSRDTSKLSETQVRETALESLAENLNDSVVAPLFWFALAGLPGAALYRFANTADAMWGYRGERGGRVWEWAGKWTAHADDLLSWLPARLTALLLALAAGGLSLARLRREALITPSPNGGWPMGALALALGVRLGKPGVYTLNATGQPPGPHDTERACALAGRALSLIGISLLILSLTQMLSIGLWTEGGGWHG